MSQWPRLGRLLVCLLAIIVDISSSFRLPRHPQRPSHAVKRQYSVLGRDVASEANRRDDSTSQLVVHPPLKALWDVVGEYLVPICHPWARNRTSANLPILLSCSGGQDSMAMLHALGLIKKHATSLVKCSAWRRLLNAKREDESAQVYETVRRLLENVHVVYFDHRARDDTSTDIEVVRAACDLYGFDFIVEAAAGLVVDLGHDDGTGNFQKAARDWRRGAYKRLIEELPPPKAHPATSKSSDESAEAVRIFNRHVLTQESDGLVDRSTHRSYFHRGTRGIVLLAHHANDSVETFLFKLLRGVHVSNLMGIEHVSYLDSDKDIVLVRPFVHLTKQDLRSFLERVGGTFNEDSSNADSKYLRNRIRNSVVPELLKAMSPDNPPEVTLKTLNKRIRTLAAQSRELRSSLDIETYAFSHYVSSKYGLPNFVAPPQEATTAVERGGNRINWLVSSYGDFYKRMSSVTYGDRVCEKTRKYIRTLQFLRGVGFNTKEVLLIKEWLLVPSELTRKDILYKFCLRAAGKEVLLDHSLLERLSASWSSEPVSDVLKMHFLHAGRAICHQGSLVKVHRTTTFRTLADDPAVYDDGYCSFRVFDNFTAHISPLSRSAVESGFHLRLSVPSEGIGGRPAEFDIRQLRDDDIVPCDSLWNRKASSVLARMNFPPVLRDELPVIALRDSNHVLCFYGVSISAPFYVSAPQHANISFGKDAVPSDERREYVVRVIGT